MKIKNKLNLSEDELREVLVFFNASHHLVKSMQDGFTCTLEEISKLQIATFTIERLFNFKPQKMDCGHPNHWGDYVLSNNEKAYFSDYELEQMQAKTEKETTK